MPEDLLPPGFENISLPNIEDGKKLAREKCIKVSGSDAAYEQVEQSFGVFSECVMSIVNVTQLQDEIKQAEPTGDLDTVFNK